MGLREGATLRRVRKAPTATAVLEPTRVGRYHRAVGAQPQSDLAERALVLLSHGPASAVELAEALGVTTRAVGRALGPLRLRREVERSYPDGKRSAALWSVPREAA